jgi:hypothetical protein
MNRALNMDKLLSLSKVPTADSEMWLISAEASVEFLKENAKTDEIVLYASLPHVLIHGVLAPLDRLQPPDQDDLLRAQVFPDDSWAVQHASGGGEEDRVYLNPPLSTPGCKTLVGGEKLVFRRTFHEVPSKATYTEISQKLVHAFDLHFLEERGAYCRLDSHGDIEEVIRIVDVPKSPDFDGGIVVTIRAKELAEYMALSEDGLVILFDFTRFNFIPWLVRTHPRDTASD